MDAAVTAADPDGRAEAADRLTMYRMLAESRVEALRAQVHGLERLSRDIRAIQSAAGDRAVGGR